MPDDISIDGACGEGHRSIGYAAQVGIGVNGAGYRSAKGSLIDGFREYVRLGLLVRADS